MISAMVVSREWREASDDAERRTRPVKRRTWAAAIGALVLVAVGFALFAGGSPPPTSSGAPAARWEDLGFALSVVAFVVMAVAVLRMVRARMFSAEHLVRSWSLSFRRRRQAARWIRRGETVPDGAVQVAMDTAEAMVAQRTASPLYIGLALNTVGICL